MVITHETHVFAGSNPHPGFWLATQIDFLFLIPPKVLRWDITSMAKRL